MAHEFWTMPNPLLAPFQAQVAESVDRSLRGVAGPIGVRLAQFLDGHPGLLMTLAGQKLEKEHQTNLEAIAAELAAEGRDVGPPPWVRSNPRWY